MKKLKLTTVILLMAAMAYGQGVAINEDGAAPDPSAMLEVTSTEKGILIPRMTQAQRDAIAEPATGLLIFQTDATPGFYFNAGTTVTPAWQRLGEGSAGQWSQSGDNIYYLDGNVGIGTTTPSAILHTAGEGEGEGNVLFTGVYKHSNPGDPPASGSGTRMMWYPDKAAFRVGGVTGNLWNINNIGVYSFASGYNTKAEGAYSTAMGFSTSATQQGSVAIGYNSTASGYHSMAMGTSANASAWGSTAIGYGITAPSGFETVIGCYNTTYTPNHELGWAPNDRLFVIGNGTSDEDRSDAMVVLKNGNTGIGTSSPLAQLHTTGSLRFDGAGTPGEGKILTSDSEGNATWEAAAEGSNWSVSGSDLYREDGNVGIGTTAPSALFHAHGTGKGEGNVLFSGWVKLMDHGDPPAQGQGTRMMWYPDKAAFRAGFVDNDQWNKDNIGSYSMAFGHTTTASGAYSFAMGHQSVASGPSSTAIGILASASGFGSIAMGGYLTAPSVYETVFGRYNTTYNNPSGMAWVESDRLFVIGNGTAEESRSNAFTILKNGNAGFGNNASNPSYLLSLGDNGTGLHHPSANTLTIHTNASERIRIASNGNVGIGTESPGSHRLRVISSASGGSGATGYFENEHSSGIALWASTESSDGTTLLAQRGEGYILRLDGYDPNWFVAMVVKGRQVGINTSSMGSYNLAVNGTAAKTDGGSWSTLSDARFKTIKGNYSKGLIEITQLQPVNFHYKSDNPYGFDPEQEQTGFVAQDVMKVFPEAVSSCSEGYLDFNMHAINVALVNAVKELKKENDRLRAADYEMRSRIERLEKLVSTFSENR